MSANSVRPHRITPLLSAAAWMTVLLLTACTPEQTPASAARTAAALRTPAAAPATSQPAAITQPTTGSPGTSVPAPLTPAVVGQGPSATATTGGPLLVASQTAIPADPGRLTSVTIFWNTGGPDLGQVYVSENGQAEKLFAAGSGGSQDAPWIRGGAEYEFRLYAGTEHARRLATVSVGMGAPPTRLSAAPNPVPADDQELGATTISWATDGPPGGDVYVSEDGGPERLFASGTSGSEPAGWICRGVKYEFYLYAAGTRSDRIGTVMVTRGADPPDHPAPAPVRCHAGGSASPAEPPTQAATQETAQAAPADRSEPATQSPQNERTAEEMQPSDEMQADQAPPSEDAPDEGNLAQVTVPTMTPSPATAPDDEAAEAPDEQGVGEDDAP